MGYDPVYVGYPFFIFRKEWFASGMYPLYIPWMFLFWITEFFKESDIAFLLRKAMYPWLGISLFAVVLTISYFFRASGTARWARKKISRRKVSLTMGRVVYGQLFIQKYLRPLIKEGSVSLHEEELTDNFR